MRFLFFISFMISSGGFPKLCISCSKRTISACSTVSSSNAATMARVFASWLSNRVNSSSGIFFPFFLSHGG